MDELKEGTISNEDQKLADAKMALMRGVFDRLSPKAVRRIKRGAYLQSVKSAKPKPQFRVDECVKIGEHEFIVARFKLDGKLSLRWRSYIPAVGQTVEIKGEQFRVLWIAREKIGLKMVIEDKHGAEPCQP